MSHKYEIARMQVFAAPSEQPAVLRALAGHLYPLWSKNRVNMPKIEQIYPKYNKYAQKEQIYPKKNKYPQNQVFAAPSEQPAVLRALAGHLYPQLARHGRRVQRDAVIDSTP